MKKLSNKTHGWLVLMVLAVIVTACQKATFLKVDNENVNATIEGGSGDIPISTDGKSVKVVYAPQWVEASVNEGYTALHYEIALNTDQQLREDSIVLGSSDLTCVIHVTQSYKATYIKFDKDTVEISKDGGTVEVNVEVDATTPLVIDNNDFAKVEGRKIVITLPKNKSIRKVLKELKVSCDDISANLTVKQESNACLKCNGDGFLNQPCPECNGFGYHMCCNYTGRKRCPACGGSGIAK